MSSMGIQCSAETNLPVLRRPSGCIMYNIVVLREQHPSIQSLGTATACMSVVVADDTLSLHARPVVAVASCIMSIGCGHELKLAFTVKAAQTIPLPKCVKSRQPLIPQRTQLPAQTVPTQEPHCSWRAVMSSQSLSSNKDAFVPSVFVSKLKCSEVWFAPWTGRERLHPANFACWQQL